MLTTFSKPVLLTNFHDPTRRDSGALCQLETDLTRSHNCMLSASVGYLGEKATAPGYARRRSRSTVQLHAAAFHNPGPIGSRPRRGARYQKRPKDALAG